MEFCEKNFVKLFYLISRVFLDWTLLNFLAHCEILGSHNLPTYINFETYEAKAEPHSFAIRSTIAKSNFVLFKSSEMIGLLYKVWQ